MSKRLAIEGSYADFKIIKSRGVVQIIIEAPIETGADVVKMFGIPQPGAEIRVGVARLAEVHETIEHEPRPEPRKWGTLSRAQQAGIRCNEPAFWRFLAERHDVSVINATDAADAVRVFCDVKSRSDLDRVYTASQTWDLLTLEFDLWMKHPELAA